MRTSHWRFPVLVSVLATAAGFVGSLAAQGAAAETDTAPLLAVPAAVQTATPGDEPTVASTGPTPSSGQELNTVVTGDRTIEAGTTVDGVVVVGGDLRVRGEVSGDAVVLNGDLILEATGVVLGDALVTNGRILNEGGRVRGEMLAVGGGSSGAGTAARSVTSGDAAGRAASAASEARVGRDNGRGGGWFDSIQRGIAGVISTLALGLVLAGIGAALVFYAKPQLETVSDTIRVSTLRAGATGLAATFLVVPAFIVLVVALAVSIVGIPLLILAVPLYPVALVVALGFGLLAASHAIGERTAEQNRDALDSRYRNSYAYLFIGVGMLILPLVASYLVSMTGILGFVGGLLRVVTGLAIWAAATVGFGAVILSYAGRRGTYAGMVPEMGDYDNDPFFADSVSGDDDHVR